MDGHKLYNELAVVYHEMYQTIFDYDKEFLSYQSILDDHKCTKICEVGCGSGSLAKRFLGMEKYDYTGVDLSREMLKIATKEVPKARFVEADMRDICSSFPSEKFDAVCITGRSFTYMTTNDDVGRCLKSIRGILKPNGILVFDNFNAEKIFKGFKGKFESRAKFCNREYLRECVTKMNLETGWTWNIKAKYTITETDEVSGEKKVKIVDDSMLLRAFLVDELALFLHLSGYKILEKRLEDTCMVFIAQFVDKKDEK